MAGDHLELEGTVVSTNRDKYTIELKDGDGQTIIAQISGKMRQKKIRVNLDDEVVVKVSPYDLTNGIIVYRKK